MLLGVPAVDDDPPVAAVPTLAAILKYSRHIRLSTTIMGLLSIIVPDRTPTPRPTLLTAP